jgi:phage terminase large subunit-like protein
MTTMEVQKPTKTIGEHVIRFVEKFCVHTIGEKAGQPLILEQWQKDFINEMYMCEWDGERWRYTYQTILLMVPRGAGKSTLAAALSLYALANGKTPRVLIAAATRENAKHVYDTARDMVHLNQKLADFVQANKNLIWCQHNRGELRRLSGDGRGQFGHIPSFVVRDELHTWVTDKQVQLSEALQTALAKAHNAQSLTVTTAGYDKHSILGELYDSSMKSELLENPQEGLYIVRDRDNRFLFWCFEAPRNAPPDDPETWHIAQPASWIDEDAIRAQLNDPSIGLDEFRRQWLNQWTAAKQSWLPLGLWQSLESNTEIPDKARIQIGIDAALTKDTTAVSWAYQANADSPVVLRSHVWAANEDASYDVFVPGGRIDLRLVREYIHDVLKPKYQVTEIVYDPRFFDTLAQELSDDGFTVAPFLQQSQQMADALNQFYVAAHENKITHNGDPTLAAHIDATAGVQTERGWKLFKLRQSKHIDATIASVMAFSRARADLKRRNQRYIY